MTDTRRGRGQSPPIGAREIMRRIDALAEITETPGMVTRTYLTAAQKEAGQLLISWMEEAGMHAGFDAAANVVGRYEGRDRKAKPVMIGSHYDTVVNAGKFDGPYGIVAAIAVVDALHRQGRRLGFPLEVVAFAEEEGVRFKATLIGSRALTGALDPAVLDMCDSAGVRLEDARHAFHGRHWPIEQASRRKGDLAGYIELHIEQGPVLLQEAIPVGVVTAIAGASRFAISVVGKAGHAGTVPMGLRRDAAAGAAEIVLTVERVCRDLDGLVGTVGLLSTPGGATNVVPGRVDLSLDVRADTDAKRRAGLKAIRGAMREIAKRRSLALEIRQTHDAAAVQCDARLQAAFAVALTELGVPVRRLTSGAGHDAMAMARICPVAMLFVRCGKGGISHDPAETMTEADALTGARVLLHTLTIIDRADA